MPGDRESGIVQTSAATQELPNVHLSERHDETIVDADKSCPNPSKRIIIVGAGAAGLTAAKRLVVTGQEWGNLLVTILEASSVFGGRVQKDTTGFIDYPLDLGASWVFDPTRLPLIAQNQKIRKEMKDKTIAPASMKDFKAYNIRDNGKKKKMEMEEDMNHLWINYTWFDFLADHVASALDRHHFIYNCTVDRIVRRDDDILVACGERQFFADHVLVTASLAVLQDGDINFQPPLPKAILGEEARMWQGFKILFEFSVKFYHDVFEWSPDDGELDFWDYSLVQLNTSRHLLAGYYVGQPSDRFQSLSKEDIARQVLNDLDELFGNNLASDHYLKHIIIDWGKDFPFIRGIYSSRSVSSKGPKRLWGAKLFFAGEAFPVPPWHNGWVDGAALSGLHAAELILHKINPERLPLKDFSIPDDIWEDE
jgi:monoamine oxidase